MFLPPSRHVLTRRAVMFLRSSRHVLTLEPSCSYARAVTLFPRLGERSLGQPAFGLAISGMLAIAITKHSRALTRL